MNKTIYLGIVLFSLIFSVNLSAQFQLDVDGDARIFGNFNVDRGQYQSWGPIFIRPDSDNSGDDDIHFLDNTDEIKMIISKSGNVGIGTTSPTEKLEVVGNMQLLRGSTTQGLSRELILEGARNASGNPYASIVFNNLDDDDDNVNYTGAKITSHNSQSADEGDLRFFTNNGASIEPTQRMIINSNGNIGINLTNSGSQIHLKMNSGLPTAGIRMEQFTNTNYWNTRVDGNDYKFEYNGTLKGYVDNGTGNFVTTSDSRLKKNISSFPTVLENVMQLRPTTYHYRDVEQPERKAWGFIAQEVGEVFPEMVYQNGEYKSLAYSEFAVLAIKAIQELNDKVEKEKTTKEASIAQNEALIAKVNELENQMATIQNLDALLEKANALEAKLAALEQLEQKVKQIESDVNFCCQSQGNLDINAENTTEITLNEAAHLKQNTPNPFNEETTIEYYLPKGVNNAQIQITDRNGRVLKLENDLQIGHGSIKLNAKAVPSGTYAYSLLVDGQLVETKQMIMMK